MKRLDGMRALVSGGACEVGGEVVRALVENGASVVAVDSTDELIEAAIASLGLDDPEDVFTRGLDATDLGSWWDLSNLIGAYFHALDVFVHVAEPRATKRARELSIDELRNAQASSAESFLMAIGRLQQSLIEAGKESASGASVIAISSPGADGSAPGLPGSAMRASVVAMVEAMAREFSDESLNIRVNAIQPGAGRPSDVARAVGSAVVELASEAGRTSNGSEWVVDAKG